MAVLTWDAAGERIYETGVSNGVLFIPDNTGDYAEGFAWNGLTTITQSPSGAESNPQFADNIKYVDIRSAEEFGGTIEAFTYPDEWEQCDGTGTVYGVSLGQQTRKTFGLVWKTLIGNDLVGTDYGYKLHLVWSATAAPSEQANATVNDSPEAVTFSWEFSTTSVAVGTVDSVAWKPLSSITVNSTKVDADALADLEDILFGTEGVDPRLPSPAEVLALFAGSVTEVTLVGATGATYNSGTHVVTIPTVTGVTFKINGVTATAGAQAAMTIGQTSVVTAHLAAGYVFSDESDNDWVYAY